MILYVLIFFLYFPWFSYFLILSQDFPVDEGMDRVFFK